MSRMERLPEFYLPLEHRVWSIVRVKPKKVCITIQRKMMTHTLFGKLDLNLAEKGGGNTTVEGFLSSTVPCLEDEGEILLPENDPRCVPADALHVDVHDHQVCAFLVRVLLHIL